MSLFYELWTSVPPITRTCLLISLGLSALVSLELCTPYKLYFNWQLILNKGQYWRAISCLFFYGDLSAHTIFDIMLFYWYASKLEQGDFWRKPADFVMFLVFCCSLFLVIASQIGL